MKDVTTVLVTTTLISLLPYQGYSFVLPSHSWGTGNQGRSKVLISNSRVYVQNIPFFGGKGIMLFRELKLFPVRSPIHRVLVVIDQKGINCYF